MDSEKTSEGDTDGDSKGLRPRAEVTEIATQPGGARSVLRKKNSCPHSSAVESTGCLSLSGRGYLHLT